MTNYESAQALRTALEDRLRNNSATTGVSLDRLRRRVVFECIVARLEAAEPGLWVLKGGMALEVRLGDRARLTKDIDLGLRADIESADAVQERLVDALAADPHGDRFEFGPGAPQLLGADAAGHVTWRVSVAAILAGRDFGGIRLDVSPRAHELVATERLVLPNSLEFAGVPSTVVEVVDIDRHAAEKFHAMLRDFGDRENTRVRDLVDLVLLVENRLLTPVRTAASVREVWAERDHIDPPIDLPVLPESWPGRYEKLAAEHGLATPSFTEAQALLRALWHQMFRWE